MEIGLVSCTRPIYAADGPIARIHQLLESDRSGYRKHVEDNRERPGDQVTTMVDSERAAKLVPGHKIGKEVKHYYMRNPDNYSPEQFGWHPKLEVSFQTSITDETVYWDREDALDIEQCRRELEEMLMNVLGWSRRDRWRRVPRGRVLRSRGSQTAKPQTRRLSAPGDRERTRARDHAPLGRYERQRPSDYGVATYGGGEISPKDAAEKTGYS